LIRLDCIIAIVVAKNCNYAIVFESEKFLMVFLQLIISNNVLNNLSYNSCRDFDWMFYSGNLYLPERQEIPDKPDIFL